MHPVDLAVLGLYLVGCTLMGARLGAGVQGLRGYFLGEGNIPTWAVMLSIVATETSTATFLSVPAVAFRPGGDLTYLQLPMGYLLGRLVVALLLLPAYFRGELFTAYQVLHERFGGATQKTASVLFLVMRTLGDGLRLFLAAVVLERLTGWPLAASVVVMGLVTILYTYLGGMRAVIWTDVIQFAVYIGGALVALGFLVRQVPGGLEGVLAAGRAAGKLRVLDLRPTLTVPYTLWAGLIGGLFLSTATHGADQLMVQRYLAARSQRQATLALLASGVVVFAQFGLFLFIGVSLFALYRGTPQERMRPDAAFITFLLERLPQGYGLTGLLVAAIFAAAMSTLSSSLNSSATTTVNDLIRPALRDPSEAKLLRLARWLTAGWGLAQMGVALVAIGLENQTIVERALEIASFVTGIMLGLFLLGVLTRRVGQASALVGLVTGLLVVSYVRFGPLLGSPWYPFQGAIAWPWFALIGSMTVFGVGLLTSLVEPAHVPLAAEDSPP